jgi:hypothetical protein
MISKKNESSNSEDEEIDRLLLLLLSEHTFSIVVLWVEEQRKYTFSSLA